MKPKYGKPLKHFTIRVTEDQLNFLQSLDNASEWLRHAIDSKMFEETTDVLSIVRRIEYLEKEKSRIYGSEEYKLARKVVQTDFSAGYYNLIKKKLEQPDEVDEKPPVRFYYDEPDVICCRFYDSEYFVYYRLAHDLITQTDFQDFVSKHNIEVASCGAGYRGAERYGRDIMVKFFDMLKKKIAYMKKVYEKYTLKVTEIQKEIDSLRQKLMREA